MSTTPLRRNFVFNLIYPMMRLAVAIVTVPIYVHHVGDARYGVIFDCLDSSRVFRLSGSRSFARVDQCPVKVAGRSPTRSGARALDDVNAQFLLRPRRNRPSSISLAAICLSTFSLFPTP